MISSVALLVIAQTIPVGNGTFRGDYIGPDRTALYAGTSYPEPFGTAPNRARIVIPQNYDGSTALPLVIMLHGLDTSADTISMQFAAGNPLSPRWAVNASVENYFLLLPNGTRGPTNHPHWNATDACCWFNAGFPNQAAARDDVGYIRDLIQTTIASYNVDSGRIYVYGYSNGAFMAYRLACEIPEMLAAIVTNSGATFQNEAFCVSTVPISVLHIHGTCDTAVRFADSTQDCDGDGGLAPIQDNPNVPGAITSFSRFAQKAHCDTSQLSTITPLFDLWHSHIENGINGTVGGPDDTTSRRFSAGCDSGYRFDFWEISKATHGVFYEYDRAQILDGVLPNERIYTWMRQNSRAGVSMPVCGNGILETGEVCDDGNDSNEDSCSTNCIAQTCQPPPPPPCIWQP